MKNSTITAVISSGDIKQTAITRENKRPSKNTPAKLDSAGLIWQQRPACCCRKSTRVSACICWQNCEEGKVAFAWGRTSTAGSFSHAQCSINTRPLQALIFFFFCLILNATAAFEAQETFVWRGQVCVLNSCRGGARCLQELMGCHGNYRCEEPRSGCWAPAGLCSH